MYFKNELKKAIFNKVSLFAIILNFIFYFIGGYENFPFPSIDYAELFIYSQRDGTFSLISLLFPITACLPYTTSYIAELESGYINILLTKITLTTYICTKTLIVIITGFLVMIIPSTVYLLLLIFSKGLVITEYESITVTLFAGIYKSFPLLYIVMTILNASICSSLFALMGLSISAWKRNKFLTVIIPFSYYLFSAIILKQFNPYLNSINLFTLNNLGPFTITSNLIYEIVIIVLGIYFFQLGVTKDAK
ncbi:MAG: hypothetical protein ACK5JH_13755 [Anaerocolumna sp.]